MNDKIAVTTSCWGTYWDRFGAEFINSMEQCQPAEVSIVTNQKIVVPSWFTVNRPRSAIQMWDWTNEAVENCQSEWIIVAGVDDIYFENAFHDLDLSGDAISIALVDQGSPQHSPGIEHWENELLLPESQGVWNPTIVRRDVFLKYPWRRVVNPDWIQALEFRYNRIDIRFDHRFPRFEHRMFPGNHSYSHSPRGDAQVRQMKRLLETGNVIPGQEWMPLGGDWTEDQPRLSARDSLLELRRKRQSNRQ